MAGTWVQETSYGVVTYILRELAGEWSNQVWQWFSKVFDPPVAVLADPLVERLVRLSVAVALGAMPLLIGAVVIRETFARLDGTSIVAPEAIVRRAIHAGMAVTGTSLVAWFMVSLAVYAREALAGIGLDIDLLKQFFDSPLEPAATTIILAIAFALGAVMLIIQRTVIAAELTLLLAIGPLMAATLARDERSAQWKTWLQELSSLLITPLVQMIVLQIFLRHWAQNSGQLQIGDRLASLAFLYLLYTVPRWARQMVYSVDMGNHLGNASVAAYRLLVFKRLIQGAIMA